MGKKYQKWNLHGAVSKETLLHAPFPAWRAGDTGTIRNGTIYLDGGIGQGRMRINDTDKVGEIFCSSF
jgi:hypothetical protein